MALTKTENDEVLDALADLKRAIENLFILQATLSGVGQREVRKMLGINRTRISRIAKHVKKETS